MAYEQSKVLNEEDGSDDDFEFVRNLVQVSRSTDVCAT